MLTIVHDCACGASDTTARVQGRWEADFRPPGAQADVWVGYVSSRRVREERSCPCSEQAKCHVHTLEIAPRLRESTERACVIVEKRSGVCVSNYRPAS